MSSVRTVRRRIPIAYKFIAAAIVLLGAFVAAMVFGAADISVKDVWLGMTSDAVSEEILIIREIRLPREIAAIVVGAALAVSGAIMQGMTRNPLADPGLLGLTAGANAALAMTIAFGTSASYSFTMVACFIGAAVGAGMVFGLSSLRQGGLSPLRIVLAGSAVSAFLLAIAEGIGITFKVSKDVSMWTAGGMIGTTWSQLQVVIPCIVGGLFVAMLLSRQLTILSLNESVAVGLGQRTAQVRAVLFAVIIILAGASVALIGNIAFVGLAIPHVVRAIVGTDYRYVLPMSALVGSTFMLAADTVGRTLNAPFETPVVAIVAILGLPFFLIVARRAGRAFS
ncbi:FecCD family ABC transporter permease [Paenibacillus sp. GCM10023252]|uniref:FecCD family ABC transporter permease n=1 Tax=Paenibacillus sp. GCM10023252 TaxID=3252649 RepID=UPI0036150775